MVMMLPSTLTTVWVKAVLSTSSANGKHARWWSKVFGTGVKSVSIVYRSGKENANADTLSRIPVDAAPESAVGEGDMQVFAVTASTTIPELLHATPSPMEDVNYYAQ